MTKKALFYLTLTAIATGLAAVINKAGLNAGLNSLSFALMATLIAAIIPFFYVIANLKEVKRIERKNWLYLITLGVVHTGTARFTLYIGQSLTSAMNVGFLQKTSVVFTAIFAYFMVRERISRSQILPMVIPFVGVFLLTTSGHLQIPRAGDLLIVSTAMQWGIGNSLAKITMGKVPPNMISALNIIIGAVFMLVVVFSLIGLNAFAAFLSGFWYVIASAMLMDIFVFAFFKGLDLSGPTRAVTFVLTSAVFCAMFAYLILGERLSLIQGVGAIIILAGVYLLAKST